jgi:hypothetical protein
VRHQIGVLAPVARSFLIPDNHVGRPTVSSIAVAHEVCAMGGASIACLNSRGAFDGVHLVPVSRYREIALRLERELAG